MGISRWAQLCWRLSFKLVQISKADQSDAVISIPLIQKIHQVTMAYSLPACYSRLARAAIGCHFSLSSAVCFFNASGPSARGISPEVLPITSFTSDKAIASLIASLSRAIIGAGVLGGA